LSSIETPRRVILLGASNVWFSQAWWLPALRQDRNGPCEVLGAYGHGRSYGLRSRVGFRQLESILRCGLWRALDEGPTLPTTAVIADVGNDIAYGVAVDRLLGWVEECVGRLLACGAGVTVSGLPTESVSRLSPASFSFLRRLLFPTHSIDREEAISRMGAAEKGLERMADRHHLRFIPTELNWYRLDPIHIRPSKRRQAWQRLLYREELSEPDLLERFAYLGLRPQRWWSWGQECTARQPIIDLKSGFRLSLW